MVGKELQTELRVEMQFSRVHTTRIESNIIRISLDLAASDLLTNIDATQELNGHAQITKAATQRVPRRASVHLREIEARRATAAEEVITT